ncbi:AzlC family ABC transporter permease [Erwinia tracheiphila]|uniref:Azaleucine resistance protein AzlC n=1 Tax=Erwinia tracheiphila TaxID=65700 RepID=A0A0M2KHR4_9GAMM|nr:AzlC family ABC transporter permease [Erwinia tracheiphila]AXF78132.1 azaleucine resistance protein AzlC [Erwinia tracheiphila]EOS94570.1 azaleucine resistance protein AzlC [Erwinia tracheiphila PSU-1]KKF36857.1 azaleucine resistance protein AzlC [Erwinia tracheiphila]UIA83154.1 AzlC family ABC transporter permease [Erwinia tracheiphila]UIA88192.1 AzlC family ABC transporter permease [Erwinia tracheiphila]
MMDKTIKRALMASLPIVTGYLPIAFAFGMAGVVNGLPGTLVVAMSALIFAGGSQFVLLAAMHAGTAWYLVLGMCAMMDIRHLLYGAVMVRQLPAGLVRQLLAAATLTDEVFATALVRMPEIAMISRSRWLSWLGIFSYLAWVTGTGIGLMAGLHLSNTFPLLAEAMPFALPALFVVMVQESFTPQYRVPVIVSVVVSGALYLQGLTVLALIAGAFAGCCAVCLKGKHTDYVL